MRPAFENVREPKVSCGRQSLDLPPMRWPYLVRDYVHAGARWRIRPIGVADAEPIALLYNTHYPYLYRSARHHMLAPDFYLERVCLAENWDEQAASRHVFFGTMERLADDRSGAPERSREGRAAAAPERVFAFGIQRDPHDRTMQMLAIVLDPKFRGAFLMHRYIEYVNEVFAESGADYVFGTAQVKDVIAQKVALRAGFRVGGMMPGAFRWSFDGRTYYRDMLVYMYRYCGDAERYSTTAEDWQLAPQVAQAWRELSRIDEGSLDRA